MLVGRCLLSVGRVRTSLWCNDRLLTNVAVRTGWGSKEELKMTDSRTLRLVAGYEVTRINGEKEA